MIRLNHRMLANRLGSLKVHFQTVLEYGDSYSLISCRYTTVRIQLSEGSLSFLPKHWRIAITRRLRFVGLGR